MFAFNDLKTDWSTTQLASSPEQTASTPLKDTPALSHYLSAPFHAAQCSLVSKHKVVQVKNLLEDSMWDAEQSFLSYFSFFI